MDHIEDLYIRESADHRGEVIAIEYTKCIDGERAGQSWWRQTWATRRGIPEYMIFQVAGVDVFFPPKSAKALKDHFMDFKDGQVVIT